MNWNRKAWERRHPSKRNHIAKELRENKIYRPKVILDSKRNVDNKKLNPRDIEEYLEDDE